MPSSGDRLPAGLGGIDDPTGIPGLGPVTPPVLGTKSESKVSGQVVLAGLVLIVSGGAIYGMRFVGLNAGFGKDDVKIDYTSQASSPETTRRFGRVMTELDASMAAVQFARSQELPATPFTRPSTGEPVQEFVFSEPTNLDDLERLARMAEEQRLRQLEERSALLRNELSRLQVQSVMAGGRMPVARINGQPVTIGKFLGSFEVVDIVGQSVFISADGITWELQIGMPPKILH
jgi:hypothetical protein